MKIVNRYILNEITQYFLISLLAFVGMLLTIRMIKLANLVVNRGVAVTDIARIFVAIIPTFLEIALPLAALLGVMLAIARLSGDSELIVLRGSGLSIGRIVLPVALFGIIITLVGQFSSLFLRPWGFRTVQDGLFQIAKSKSIAGLEAAVFNELGGITLYAQTVEHGSGKMQQVLVDDKRDQSLRRVIVAKRGLVRSHERERSLSLVLYDGTIHEQVEGKYVLTRFVENTILLDSNALYGDEEERRGRKVAELTNEEIDELSDRLRSLKTSVEGQPFELETWKGLARTALQSDDIDNFLPKDISLRLNRNQIEKGRRISLPCAALFLALLGLGLGVQPARAQRAWGASLSIGLGMGVFVLYYVAFSVGITLAESGALPALAALWLPNIAVAVLAGFILRKIALEQWSSVSIGLQDLLSRAYAILEHLLRFSRSRA